jgi:hypothetical protein
VALIPGPLGIGNALCVYLEDGPGIRNNEKNQRHATGLYVRARFCSYAFLSKRIWVNMKYNLKLKKKIQPVVEGPKFKKPQAASNKLDNE